MSYAPDGLKIPGIPLLPHERWFARWGINRQEINQARGRPVLARVNYGPVGNVLLFATFAWALPGMAVAVLTLLVAFATMAAPIAYWFYLASLLIMAPGVFRAIQARKAGQRFRNGRPYQK